MSVSGHDVAVTFGPGYRPRGGNMIDEPETPSVELWVRDSANPGIAERQATVYEQLQRYEEAGWITAVESKIWGKHVRCPTETDGETGRQLGADVWATYRHFEDWAAEHGVDLEPGFSRREQTTLLGTQTCDVVVLPLLCLAVYDGRELAAVFPCSTGSRRWTVDDGLAVIDPGAPTSWRNFARQPIEEPTDHSGRDGVRDVSTST